MHSRRAFALHNVVHSVPLRAANLVVLCQRHGRRKQKEKRARGPCSRHEACFMPSRPQAS